MAKLLRQPESEDMATLRHKAKALLLDDDKLVRIAITAFLKDSDLVVESTSNAQDAIEMIQKTHFDVVITDIMMEPIDGFAFRDLVRSYNRLVPILFLTSLVNGVDNALLNRIMTDPYSYYIPKNASKLFLVNKLKQALHASEAIRERNQMEEKIEKSLELASLIQRSMLPPWAHFSDAYEFSCFYHPLNKISGDLFEWIPLSESSCLLVFGDVSGHGTHSALAMMAVQAFLKRNADLWQKQPPKPHAVAQEIGDFLYGNLHGIAYMCALIAVWDFERNLLRYYNAGYVDMERFRTPSGERIPLNPERKGGLPLGMIPDAQALESETVECVFDDGDRFLVYSDGVHDLSSDPNGENGMDMDVFHDVASTLIQQEAVEDNAISIPFRCYNALKGMGWMHPQDDCTLFVIGKPHPSRNQKTFVCRISANNQSVDDMVQVASEFVLAHCGSEDLSFRLELLLGEYLVNIIRHGLEETSRQNEFIVLKVVVEERDVKIVVWDRGREWNSGANPAFRHPNDVLDERNAAFAESGRGLSIVLKIAPDIRRQRYSGLNETVFRIPMDDFSKPDDARGRDDGEVSAEPAETRSRTADDMRACIRRYLAEQIGSDDPALLDELYQEYVRTLSESAESLRKALDEDRRSDVAKQAHALKGSAGIVGDERTRDAAAALELAMKNNETDKAEEILRDLTDRAAAARLEAADRA